MRESFKDEVQDQEAQRRKRCSDAEKEILITEVMGAQNKIFQI